MKSRIPAELEKLSEISRNIWWAWNFEATELFRDLDPELWKECGQNPVLLLERMSYEKLEALAKDKVILRRMNDVYTKFRDYMDVKPDENRPSVAYFSMEYGLSSVLKIYSGGLGVLAGDYLKEASDSNVDLCAVGFLYRYGYFTQTLSMDGQQIANYEAQNFGQLPIDRVMDANGQPLVVDVPYLDYYVHANVWRVNVGRISLYLLDTDNEMNSEFDRPITHQLYGGDWENRLKQEILLGIGGILTLKALGIKKDVYHCNEGHAALINVQRICDYVATGLTFDQSIELVRASSLYTVHTPVPAGHDYFDEGLFGKYMGGYPARMGISWDDLMDLGRNNPGDKGERFCMSVFACNTSQEVNGVSWLHGKVSQEMFSTIWKGYFPEEMGLHDEDISKEEILKQGLATPEEYEILEKYTLALFKRGTEIAAERGLILVDTKYEFGKHNGTIYLMDEIHTPDSSRYFYSDGYQERFEKGEPQKQLSKEFVREWLMENGFQGKDGQKVPEMTPAIVQSISDRYIELFENITGEKFVKEDTSNIAERIEKNVMNFLSK